MYNYVNGFMLVDRTWIEKNLLDITIDDITDYTRVVNITLFDTVKQAQVNWVPDCANPVVKACNHLKLSEFLLYINSNQLALDTTDEVFSLDKLKCVSCRDVMKIGFQVKRGNRTCHPDSPTNKVGEELHLFRDNTDYSRFHNNSLFTVNGIIHPTYISDYGIYLHGGFNTIERDGFVDIAAMNFEAIGGFKITPIVKSMLYQPNGTPHLKRHKTTIRYLSGTSDKVFGIVIDGYLHLLDEVVKVLGENTLEIDWRKVPIRERFVLDNFIIRGSSGARQPKARYQEKDLFTDEWLIDILTSPFTFLLVMNATDLAVTRTILDNKTLPGVYSKEGKVKGIVKVGHGHIYSYMLDEDICSFEEVRSKHTVVNLPVLNKGKLLMDTAPADDERVLTNQEVMAKGIAPQQAVELQFLSKGL